MWTLRVRLIEGNGRVLTLDFALFCEEASCRPQPGDSMVTLVEAGTSALWNAKHRGQNRIAAYELSPNLPAEEAVSNAMSVG